MRYTWIKQCVFCSYKNSAQGFDCADFFAAQQGRVEAAVEGLDSHFVDAEAATRFVRKHVHRRLYSLRCSPNTASWFADSIRNYFGEHIAIYFAFLGFYTEFLLPATVLGVTMFFVQWLSSASLQTTAAFAIFNVLWATFFFERWEEAQNIILDRLIDWLIVWLMGLIVRLIVRSIDWLIDCLVLSFVFRYVFTRKSLLPPGWSRLFYSYIASFSL